jgi:hypothetical protein
MLLHRTRKQKPHADQPNKPWESREWNEEEKKHLWPDQVKPTQFTSDREHKTENSQPSRVHSC